MNRTNINQRCKIERNGKLKIKTDGVFTALYLHFAGASQRTLTESEDEMPRPDGDNMYFRQ